MLECLPDFRSHAYLPDAGLRFRVSNVFTDRTIALQLVVDIDDAGLQVNVAGKCLKMTPWASCELAVLSSLTPRNGLCGSSPRARLTIQYICARMVDAVQLVFLDFFFFLSEGGAVSFAFRQSVSGF